MVLHFLPTANLPACQTIHNFLDDKDLRLQTKVYCSPWLTLVLYRTMAKEIKDGRRLHPLRRSRLPPLRRSRLLPLEKKLCNHQHWYEVPLQRFLSLCQH